MYQVHELFFLILSLHCATLCFCQLLTQSRTKYIGHYYHFSEINGLAPLPPITMLEKVCGLVAATAEHIFWLLECTQHCFGGQGGWPNILSTIVYKVVYGIATKKQYTIKF